nr:unnamed protein product [Callosobruchus analis]
MKPLTIFAPLNAAFQNFGNIKEEDKDSLVLYHMTSVPKTIEQLGSSYTSLNSELAGNPPLWITHVTGKYHDDIYVNNARILVSQSNIQNTGKGLQQILHKIDEVLIPTRAGTRVFNPNAWEFLENYEKLLQNHVPGQNPYRVRNFRQRVELNKKQDNFNAEGGQTFFIPVDEGFGQNERASLIDDKVIDGHVIPKQVLFTTPTKKDTPFQTLANGDNNIRVVISFTQEQRGSRIVNYVKSHTLFGDGKHTPGVVLAEIVKANIPVKNGVVHLIQKPLMVVDSTVKQLLEQNGRILSSFFNAIKDMGPEGEALLRQIERAQDVTLFAPCNDAFDGDLTLKAMMRDKTRFLDILKMHINLEERLYMDKILKNQVYKVRTFNPSKNLYFNVVTVGDNRTLTVDGGGVNATVIQADLAATNGIIHIIDRVLGVPYTTVLDKLRTDPMLQNTYRLGQYQKFNEQLNNADKRFTYFVPRDKAWENAKVAFPSAIKKLFMPEFMHMYGVATLERHLVISDVPYTMERIKQWSNETHRGPFDSIASTTSRREVELPTVRGSLRIAVEERKDNSE